MNTLYLHALSPVHAGTGQASAAIVDLPVAREKATNWPMIPGTTIKGVCRDEVTDVALRNRLFGIEDRRAEDGTELPGNPGSLQFGDARLLCFPVRSWVGVFAYVTCPLALKRLLRDSTALGAPKPFNGDIPTLDTENGILLPPNSALSENGAVWLQDLSFTETVSATAEVIAQGIATAAFPADETDDFLKRFAIVPDDTFNFLTETATEVTAHIKLQDDTKTVQRGGLWYVESVPAEALFTVFLGGTDFPISNGTVLQFGGDANTGRGLCRVQRGGAQ